MGVGKITCYYLEQLHPYSVFRRPKIFFSHQMWFISLFATPTHNHRIEILKCRRQLVVANNVHQLMYLCNQSKSKWSIVQWHLRSTSAFIQFKNANPKPILLSQIHKIFILLHPIESNPQNFHPFFIQKHTLKCSRGWFSKVLTKYSRKYVVDLWGNPKNFRLKKREIKEGSL
jgi:hypothetical protein